jgi:hypothetical protein
MAGAGAGIVGMSATYPLDMVRGRLTVQVGADHEGYLAFRRWLSVGWELWPANPESWW